MNKPISIPNDLTSQAPLGQLLLQSGKITQAQLEQALDLQNKSDERKLIGEALVELGYVDDATVLEAIAGAYDIPFATDTARLADPQVIEELPREFLEEHGVLPLFLIGGMLTVAVSEPANLYLLEEIERRTGHSVQIVAATATDIAAAHKSYLPAANVFVIDEIYEDIDEHDFTVIEHQTTELADLEEDAGHGPVVKLVNYLIYSAVQEGASDIHIEPGDHSLRVRNRIDGKLFEKIQPPYKMHQAIASRIKIMANLDISERRLPQDGDFNVMMDGRPIDLRVSTMPSKFGEIVVMRIIDSQNNNLSLDQLGFNETMLSQWKNVVEQPNGVVLVTGPTGSGKSTTLYSVLSQLDTDEINVATIEDPIEAQIRGINQSQINNKAGFTFSSALRSMLRQDPDVLMVGEIRDNETAGIVSQAALTGHLVFSTLHTNDSVSAITRLVNLGVEPYLVAATIRGVLAQRLVRKICPHCKELWQGEDAIRAACGGAEELWKGAGCSRCRGTGFAGRIGIFELLVPNAELLDSISRGDSLQSMRQKLVTDGHWLLRQDGIEKVRNGLTTPEEVLCVTQGNIQ
ncbi:MAG TPA: ATPase, T2SS/T4P/T4SS family, partial [Phycisphaerales bacterium]|jgi:type IV pilus assembly protein PilB|nr:ATPase, T2SS/T4P/T4SS family [Phycisphaerales bacterium]|tara:strand:- start:1250 stop:2974 length:1725 start_codon:yes stop_codon:yes gene_type:complete